MCVKMLGKGTLGNNAALQLASCANGKPPLSPSAQQRQMLQITRAAANKSMIIDATCCQNQRIGVNSRFVYPFPGKHLPLITLSLENCHSKLMVSEVMSFACSDLHENGVTRGKKLLKGSVKAPFFRVSQVPSDALEFSKCVRNG